MNIRIFVCFFACGFAVASMPDHGPESNWINEQIYHTVTANPCVSLSDDKGAIGCRTPKDGVTGTLKFVNSSQALDDVLSSFTAFDPAAVLVSPQILSVETIKKMQEADNVVGIIIADHNTAGNSKPPSFSPDLGFPNMRFGLHADSDYAWNPASNGLMLQNLEKPWFSLGPEDTNGYLSMLEKAGGTRVGVEFKLQMKSTMDSQTCLRRSGAGPRWCDPLGGVSVVASLSDREEISRAQEVVAVVASMDSSSLFHTRAPGGVADISGTVAMLAAFRALREGYGNATAARPSVFHWFTAESWGYGGSKSYVKKMMEGNGFYNRTQISMLVEPKQVGSKSSKRRLHVHQETNEVNNNVVNALVFSAIELNVSITAMQPYLGIPPSSSMSFLQKLPNLPTAVLTDHEAIYENQYYHSMFDDYDNIDPALVCDAANVLANAIAKLQGYAEKKTLSANCSVVDELLKCFAGDWRCPLFREYISRMGSAPEFPTSYCGVWSGLNTMTPMTKIVHDIATEANSVSEAPFKSCNRNQDCGDLGRFKCIRNICLDDTRTWYLEAFSPAFYKDGYWKIVDDDTLPAFTESVWLEIALKTFPMVSPLTDIMTLAIGVLVTIVSCIFCFFGGRLFSFSRVV